MWPYYHSSATTSCDDWYCLDYIPTKTTATTYDDCNDCNNTWGNSDFKLIKHYKENFLKFDSITTNIGYQIGNWSYYDIESPPTPAERLKQILTDRHAPAIHVRPSKYYKPGDEREIKARETLRRVVGERNYRYFLKTGCVNVRGGKSGMMYRIYKGHMVDAYKDGVLVEQLCIYLKGNFPPADEIITKFLMIINNEEQFRAIANISKPQKSLWPKKNTLEARSLPDVFRELKKAAA